MSDRGISHTDAIATGVRELIGADARIASVQFHGRSLFELYRVQLADGRVLAAKIVESLEMAHAESDGLRALAAAGAPTPVCYGVWQATNHAPVLYMDFIAPRRTEAVATQASAGSMLIDDLLRLYAAPVAEGFFGWRASNFIGTLAQPNGRRAKFSEFWWKDRLRPQFEAAHRRGFLSSDVGRELEDTLVRCAADWGLDRLPPRLIHGDLWNGNLVVGPGGRRYLIDPSVAQSNPEQDLAMLDLFGSILSAAQLETIARNAGVGPGFSERIPFWQIYPLLVHVNIIGGSYVRQLTDAVRVYR